MGPRLENVAHYRGDQLDLTCTLTGISTALIAEAWFTVRRRTPAASVVNDDDAVTKVTKTGGGITAPATDQLRIVIAGADTSAWEAPLVYDLQIRTNAGAIYTLVYGSLNVVNDVTRSS